MPISTKSFKIPKLIQRTLVFEESLVKIQRDQLQIDQHTPYTYYTLVTPPRAVVILASTEEGAYLLTEEYRHPTGHILLSCPGGYIDTGEDPLEAAQRELLEETGFQAQSFTLMGEAFPYAGFSCQKTFYVHAQKACFASRPKLEASEIIQNKLLTPDALNQAIQAGTHLDGNLCTALFFYQLFNKKITLS